MELGYSKAYRTSILDIKSIMIMVADGRKLQSTRTVKGLNENMQGNEFMANFYIIPLKCKVL